MVNNTMEKSQLGLLGEERRNPVNSLPSYLIRKSLSNGIKQIFEMDAFEQVVLVDVGCGQKPYYPWMADKLKQYIGIDLVHHFPVDIVSLGENLPLQSACADIVVSFQVLEHVKDPPAVLREMFRVLRDDGKLVLSVPCMYVYHPTPGDYWRWTPAGFELLLEQQGFEILHIWVNGGLFTAIVVPILIQIDLLAARIARRKVIRPLAAMLYGVIIISNLLIRRAELAFPRFSDIKTKRSMPANILVLARKRKVKLKS